MGQVNVLYVCFEVSITFEPFIVLSNVVLFFISLSLRFFSITCISLSSIFLFYLLLFINLQYTQSVYNSYKRRTVKAIEIHEMNSNVLNVCFVHIVAHTQLDISLIDCTMSHLTTNYKTIALK